MYRFGATVRARTAVDVMFVFFFRFFLLAFAPDMAKWKAPVYDDFIMMISFGLSSCSALVDAVLAQVVRSLRCDIDLLGI